VPGAIPYAVNFCFIFGGYYQPNGQAHAHGRRIEMAETM